MRLQPKVCCADKNKWRRITFLKFTVLDHTKQKREQSSSGFLKTALFLVWLHLLYGISFLPFDGADNCPVFRALRRPEEQWSCSSNPRSLGLSTGLYACSSTRCLRPRGNGGLLLPFKLLPRPCLDHALGEKRLLCWTVRDCSSRSGNLSSTLPISGDPYLVPFSRLDVTLILPAVLYNVSILLRFSSPKLEDTEYFWGLRFGSDTLKGQRWLFLCHQC